jgi:hypothetical protein
MKTTPTQLSLKMLRDEGYQTLQVVEHYNFFAKKRIDLFNFIDIIGIKNGQVIGIQTTTFNNRLARCKKIAENPNINEVRKAGWIIHVHGWRKEDNRWTVKVEDCS